MRVTIDGDLDQVTDTLGFASNAPTPRKTRIAENKARREAFVARRKVVVDAFKFARSNGLADEMAGLLEAIRRPDGVTDGDIELARQVLASSVPNGE